MEIALNKKNATEASLNIGLTQADYASKVEKKVKEYAKKAEIKGFRKGKVPVGIIKNMYGKSILVEEVNHIISHAINDYIKENNLNIIGEPLPNYEQMSKIDWSTQSDFDFEYSIGLVDDFKVELTKKQKITRHEIKVDKKVIDETISNLKEQYGDMTNPELSEAGDGLYGKFTQEGTELEAQGVLETKNLGKKELKPFVGLKKGDKVSFDIRKVLPSDTEIAQALGLEDNKAKEVNGTVTLEVINVNRKVPAEINQAFFDKIFGKDLVKTEKDFIEKVENSISKNYEKESDYLLEHAIRNYFLDKVKIETPNTFLKEWLFVSNEGKVSKEQIEAEFDMYLKELKWSLIRNKISETAGIKVEDKDVKSKAALVLAEQFGGPAIISQLGEKMDEFVNSYLTANNGENYTNLYHQVAGEKVYEYIKEQVTITNKKVSVDEFRKLASAI